MWDVPPWLINGRDRFMTFDRKDTCGDAVEAVLAAGDAALALEEYLDGRKESWKRVYARRLWGEDMHVATGSRPIFVHGLLSTSDAI